jgi:hypothetical protein
MRCSATFNCCWRRRLCARYRPMIAITDPTSRPTSSMASPSKSSSLARPDPTERASSGGGNLRFSSAAVHGARPPAPCPRGFQPRVPALRHSFATTGCRLRLELHAHDGTSVGWQHIQRDACSSGASPDGKSVGELGEDEHRSHGHRENLGLGVVFDLVEIPVASSGGTRRLSVHTQTPKLPDGLSRFDSRRADGINGVVKCGYLSGRPIAARGPRPGWSGPILATCSR